MTKDKREQIAKAHAKRHGGVYRPASFVEEASDPKHPAHGWFEWDDAKASHAWRVHRARQFVSGIRIVSEIVLNEHDPVTVKSSPVQEPVSKPLMVSNLRGRYVSERSQEYGTNLTDQALSGLRLWLERYGAHLRESGEEATVKLVVRAAEGLAGKVEAA